MDREMLRRFYECYSREIYLYLYSMCRNCDTAEDMLREVFLKALLSWKDENGNLRAWLNKVARNTCLNFLKKSGREVAMEEEGAEESLSLLERFLLDEEKRVLYAGMLTLPGR